jgi:hypothetical protein
MQGEPWEGCGRYVTWILRVSLVIPEQAQAMRRRTMCGMLRLVT